MNNQTLSSNRLNGAGTAEWLRMLGRLQTSLDPAAVLHLYFEEIQQLASVDGLDWRPVAGEPLSLGRSERCRMCYGLTVNGDSLGELSMSRRRRFGETDTQLLEQSISFLIHPLRNALAHQQALLDARRDALTGLGNRAAFNENLQRELELVRRHGSPLSLLLLDVDRFKQINDRYGHTAGDEVLRTVARAEPVRAAMRPHLPLRR